MSFILIYLIDKQLDKLKTQVTKIEETGEISDLIFETGKAYWLTEDPPNTLHGDINESDEPIEVMVIEIKALEK